MFRFSTLSGRRLVFFRGSENTGQSAAPSRSDG
jgi:hypothetical protein